jgi:hypothetical protein
MLRAPGSCILRNCELVDAGVTFNLRSGDRWIMDNCVHADSDFEIRCDPSGLEDASVVLTRNTVLREGAFFYFYLESEPALPIEPLPLSTSASIFDTNELVWLRFPESARVATPPVFLPGLVAWSGEGNLYDVERRYWGLSLGYDSPVEPASSCSNLAEWKRLWPSADGDSLEGQVRYEGGDLRSKLAAAPDLISAEDFRLRPDSPGYRAGKDGNDLGAAIEFVGPGKAYERWKKTPEHQQWLKDTRQVKADRESGVENQPSEDNQP